MRKIADIIDRVHCCDTREFMKQMPSESVHCVVTSPPYWLLRDYKVFGQLGLEPTPEEYIAQMVEVFREVRRILRKDGTLWLNMGDSYNNVTPGSRNPERWPKQSRNDHKPASKPLCGNLKTKDLCMMPHRLAMALQKDGWWIRSDIVWHKPNPMPESCTDRPTKSHEYIFLCTKSAKYYYDADAVREQGKFDESGVRGYREGNIDNSHKPKEYKKNFGSNKGADADRYGKGYQKHSPAVTHPAGRNKRSVWTIPTEAFSAAHFATFPQALVEPCIKAGTSEKGCCPECGKPWVRVVEKEWKPDREGRSVDDCYERDRGDSRQHKRKLITETKIIGWQPGCKCGKDVPLNNTETVRCQRRPRPCIVFDPFMGSGTVGLVAYKLNRHWLGTELNPEYCKIAEQRIQAEKDKYGLLESR